MGKGVVYCAKCGIILREKEFTRGLAHTLDHRHFCSPCRPMATPTLPAADSDDHYVPLPPRRPKTRIA